MRVGKTLPALAIVDIEKPPQLLIVSTKKGIRVWEKEINESLRVDWNPFETQIINFDAFASKQFFNRMKRWLKRVDSFMIVDEAHRIKRRGSVWSRRIRACGKRAKWRLALTGTPIAQGIHDAWAIFDFLDRKIFGKWAETERYQDARGKWCTKVVGGFQMRYCVMGGYQNKKIVDHQNLDEFNRIFHRHSIRRTLAEVQREAGLAATKIRRVILHGELSPDERRPYAELEAELRTVVNQRRIEAPLVITLSMKLQQICGGYIKDEDEVHQLGNSKLRLFLQALDRLTDQDRPVVICRFLHELDAIVAALEFAGYKTKRIQGGVEFDPDEPITEDAIALQIQSGVAIDLAVGTCVIFYSWDFSYINHEQSRFRVLFYNIKKMTYYYLVMTSTIDELILEAVLRKKRLADLVCDHYRRR